MVEITLQVPDTLAGRLLAVRDRLPEILERGLQYPRPLSLRAYAEALEFLATNPTPAEILAFHPSSAVQMEVRRLLDKSEAGALTPAESGELDRVGDLEHMMIALKARARQQLDRGEGL